MTERHTTQTTDNQSTDNEKRVDRMSELQELNLTYPVARQDAVVERLHGVDVPDPYRWLEDLGDPDTLPWVRAQGALARTVLDASPWKAHFSDRLRQVWSQRTCHTALMQGGKYFYFFNDGSQEQDGLYVMDAPDGEPRLLLDPSAEHSEAGSATISYATASPDGSLLAYSLSFGGSDWQQWRVREVATGEDLPERLEGSKFSAAGWNADSTGFYYTCFAERDSAAEPDAETSSEAAAKTSAEWEPDLDPVVAFHRVGTDQAEDELVYEDPAHPEQGITVLTSEDGSHLILFLWRGDAATTGIIVKDITDAASATDPGFVELLPDFDASYSYVAGEGPIMWFQTDRDAPMGRIIRTDARRPGEIVEVVAEGCHAIQGAGLIGGKLYVVQLVDACSRIHVHDPYDGRYLGEVSLPGAGTVEGLRSDPAGTECFYSFTDFLRPATVYRLDTRDDTSTVFLEPELTFDPDDFVVEQVRFTADDGVEVPVWLGRHRDTPRDGARPTFLAAYGGFGFAITPSFTPGPLAWMELGGIYALANVRGGGEFGEAWHEAGSGRRKVRAVDDLIGAAEWLAESGWTEPERLAVGGMSNGGLLTTALLTRRPDVCAGVLAVNGVMDLVRFDRFTIGWSWRFEYGDPGDPDDFAALLALSPLHNVTDETAYPAALICTAVRDDRVVPAHSFKFAAALQRAQATSAPALLRVDEEAGHGRDARLDAGLSDLSDRWAFSAEVVGLTRTTP